MTRDGARWVVENEILSNAGERAAVVRSTGGWLDLRERKLVPPPPALFAALQQIPRALGFVELPQPCAAPPASAGSPGTVEASALGRLESLESASPTAAR